MRQEEVTARVREIITAGFKITGTGVSGRGLSWTYKRPDAVDETAGPDKVPDDWLPPRTPPPADCCLYPSPDPYGTPLYPPEDLPDTIVHNGITYTHVAGEYRYEGGGYSIYATTFFDEDFNPAGHAWVIDAPLGSAAEACLISEGEFKPHDEFLDTYNVTITPSGIYSELSPVETTIVRDGLCCWKWSDPSAVAAFGPLPGWRFCYGGATDVPEPYKWALGPGTPKDDPQTSPEGDYTLGDDGTVTVSAP